MNSPSGEWPGPSTMAWIALAAIVLVTAAVYRDVVGHGFVARHNLGVVFSRQGDLEPAVAQWELALRIHPHYTPAALSFVRRMSVAVQ